MRSMKILFAMALVAALVAGPVLAQETAPLGGTDTTTTSTTTTKAKVHKKHSTKKKHTKKTTTPSTTAPTAQ